VTRFALALTSVILVTVGLAAGAERAVRKPVAPKHRPHYRVGKAPRAEFKVRNRTLKVDPTVPAVKSIRKMVARSMAPAVRKAQVENYYHKVFGTRYVERTRWEPVYVGPFRSDFVYWTYDWPVATRAVWAWNNRSYVDAELWAQWMEDAAFARQINIYTNENRPAKPGFVPDRYADLEPLVIYNDDYIDAAFNPEEDDTPSIIVGGVRNGRVADLEAGAARLFGGGRSLIGRVDATLDGLEFIALPVKSDAAYQIRVTQDGPLYAFGPKTIKPENAFGDEAAKWEIVENIMSGKGIDVVYRRNVISGENIRLHGFELSVASESIELMRPATPAATLAVKDAEATINLMFRSPREGGRSGVVRNTPDLRPQLEIARDAAHDMVTETGSVDQAKVNLFHASLAKALELVSAGLGANKGRNGANDAPHDVIQRINTLEESVSAVEELRSSASRIIN
jgi:hypothetical protein